MPIKGGPLPPQSMFEAMPSFGIQKKERKRKYGKKKSKVKMDDILGAKNTNMDDYFKNTRLF